MNMMLDIIGSMVIRGSIVLMTFYLMINLQNALYKKTAVAIVKQKTVVPAQVLTDDLRLAGYGPTTSKDFAIAKSDEMQFSADINGDSTSLIWNEATSSYVSTVNADYQSGNIPEIIHYYLGAAPAGSTHRVLYRQINAATPLELARDVDSVYFTYYNVFGTSVSGLNVSGIKSVKISLVMASAEKLADEITTAPRRGGLYTGKHTVDTTSFYKTEYVKAYWERTLFPQNL